MTDKLNPLPQTDDERAADLARIYGEVPQGVVVHAPAYRNDPLNYQAAGLVAALIDGETFHLPGLHDQKNHGRRTGRRGFEPLTPREKTKRDALRKVGVDPDADAPAPARQGKRSMAQWEKEAARLTKAAGGRELPDLPASVAPGKPGHAKRERPAGQPVTPDMFPAPVQGRDLVKEVSPLLDSLDDALYPNYNRPVYYDVGIQYVGRMQGFDAPATKVSKEEMDQLIQNGATELHRGVHEPYGASSKTTDQILATADDGDYEPGSGIYGNGWYFSVAQYVADQFGGTQGRRMRAALKPNVKSIDYDEAQKLMTKERMELDGDPSISQEFLHGWGRDVGRWAVTKGYDVLTVNGPDSDCAKQQGNKPLNRSIGGRRLMGGRAGKCHGDGSEFQGQDRGYEMQVVVLNRSAIFVQDGYFGTTG